MWGGCVRGAQGRGQPLVRMNSAQEEPAVRGTPSPSPPQSSTPGKQTPRERGPGSALCSDPENEVPNSASGVTLTPQMPI